MNIWQNTWRIDASDRNGKAVARPIQEVFAEYAVDKNDSYLRNCFLYVEEQRILEKEATDELARHSKSHPSMSINRSRLQSLRN